MKSIQDVTVINEPALDPDLDLDVLDEIQQRILWLAIRMVDSANHDRDTGDGVKVGGHQASSASLVTALTALYFAHLDAADRVAIKPHASPVFHSIQYLLGQLDRSYLTRLRELGGLQSYPSRTKDPDNVDFSTGSVGLGPVAPLFAALTRRYVDDHFGQRDHSRFIAFMGDAELDEGNIWEAIADQATQGLGNVTWVVDFNRQSLDRVVPGVKVHQWQVQFLAAGWQVIEVKYGRKVQAKFKEANGEDLRAWIDAMPNEQYQSLFALKGEELRQRFLEGAPEGAKAAVAGVSDEDLAPLVKDLGGHDLASMLEAYRQADATTDRPTVIFAYTVKGWGLPSAGNPRNHSALMSTEQVNEMRARTQLTMATEWDRIPEDTAAGRWCNERAQHLERPRPDGHLSIAVPERVETRSPSKPISTQEGFGRIVTSLSRDEAVAKYLVTTAPDVATSTNLAGFINRAGVYSPDEIRDWNEDDPMLKWSQHPQGQHIELGISEMNLFLLLGQLGLSWDLSNQPLLPIGTVYDPFVCRGLDAFIYGTYSGSRFIIAGTPAGVTLAPEGGAHQSTITASIGMELPGVTFIEPGYLGALDWLLCDSLQRIASGENDSSAYFRLSTRPLDQAPFEAARERLGDKVLRRQVLAGGYRLHDAFAARPDLRDSGAPVVHLAVSGAVIPEALAAAAELADEGVAAHVVDVTSLDRLYSAWRSGLAAGVRTASVPAYPLILREIFPEKAPVVTIHDAASHAMAWIGSALGVPAVPLGVDKFGQSGSVSELYELFDLTSGSIVNAALAALALE